MEELTIVLGVIGAVAAIISAYYAYQAVYLYRRDQEDNKVIKRKELMPLIQLRRHIVDTMVNHSTNIKDGEEKSLNLTIQNNGERAKIISVQSRQGKTITPIRTTPFYLYPRGEFEFYYKATLGADPTLIEIFYEDKIESKYVTALTINSNLTIGEEQTRYLQ